MLLFSIVSDDGALECVFAIAELNIFGMTKIHLVTKQFVVRLFEWCFSVVEIETLTKSIYIILI